MILKSKGTINDLRDLTINNDASCTLNMPARLIA